MASILNLVPRIFRTRNPSRDASTDRDRLLTVRAAIVTAIESATRERDGLQQRVDDYYASASHILDQASFEDRSSTDEQAVRDAEQHGAAGLKRIAAINGQLLHLNRLLDDLDEQNATDAPNLAALRL
ncbi:MAG TPA: hypothetical protein VFE64_04830 [Devosia sp.]|jgi:hypothetical protein|nr:hypothetical protein [Devosia sp.]